MFPVRANGKHCVLRFAAIVAAESNLPMTSESLTIPDRAHARSTRRAALAFPVLDREPGALGRRLAALPGEGHPVWTYLCGIVLSFAAIAGLSIIAGLLVTRVLLHAHGVAYDDQAFEGFLARHRSTGLTDASLVGSIMAGESSFRSSQASLPWSRQRSGTGGSRASCCSPWPSSRRSYRATTLVIHRHRPTVHRLEHLPVNASYPSGHTAAAIAIYCGLALLLTSRLSNRSAQVAVWAIALLVPVFVAFSRMYRGMHHPLDVAGGVLVGIAALSALVLVSRAADLAATREHAMTKVAVIAHAGKTFGGGCPSSGGARAPGSRRPALVRGAEEPQAPEAGDARARRGRRAALRLGRRRHGAALHRRARRHRRRRSRSCRPAPRTCSPRTSASRRTSSRPSRSGCAATAASSTSAASTASASP